MKVEDLIEAAKARTGLDDFGGDSFREGLDRLVASINSESRLTDLGRLAAPEMLIASLVNRLEVEHWYRLHPEIDEERIVAPLFGVGLPRTGSTALIYMLARDPGTRSLRNWEAEKPCPPPETATEATDPRIAACAANIGVTLQRAPEVGEMLPMEAGGPTECFPLMFLEFKFHAYEAFLHIPSYIEWVNSPSCDMEPAYRYHKRVLKLLQWRCPPRRWSLKTPSHMLYIDALNKVYPDARFVMTHRDPVRVLPSLADLLRALRSGILEDPLPRWIGPHIAQEWTVALRRMIELRDRVGEGRFYDISHRAITSDALAEIRKLYRWLGWDMTAEAAARMGAWQEQNLRATRKLRPEDFGLDEASMREQYRFYTDRFSALL
ncbi:MAG TPA: sulfotransferase [Candidatus Binataceae bacterium]|nr:sulfotransferase [Candidatus Binataceae bacterium]